MLRTIAVCGIISGIILIFAPPTPAQDAEKETARTRSAAVRKSLAEPVEMPEEFKQPVPLKLVFQYLRDKLSGQGMELPIEIDYAAFKDENPESPELLESNVVYPTFLRRVAVQDAVAIALKQFPASNATQRVVDGRLLITTVAAGKNNAMLDRGVAFGTGRIALRDAIDELGDRAGLTILIDARCGAEMIKIVNVQTQQGTTARGLLTAWADMYDLKLLADDHRVVLMPRTAYFSKLRDDIEEARLLADIAKSRQIQNESKKTESPAEPLRDGESPGPKK